MLMNDNPKLPSYAVVIERWAKTPGNRLARPEVIHRIPRLTLEQAFNCRMREIRKLAEEGMLNMVNARIYTESGQAF